MGAPHSRSAGVNYCWTNVGPVWERFWTMVAHFLPEFAGIYTSPVMVLVYKIRVPIPIDISVRDDRSYICDDRGDI